LERILGIVALADEEAVVHAFHEPRPARSEFADRGLGEAGAELDVRPERLLDPGRELAGRLAPAVRLHAQPVEVVVPDLRGVVEHLAARRADQVLEALVRLGLAAHELLELLEIALVVLLVVEVDRLGADQRRERVLRIRQRRDLERHDALLVFSTRTSADRSADCPGRRSGTAASGPTSSAPKLSSRYRRTCFSSWARYPIAASRPQISRKSPPRRLTAMPPSSDGAQTTGRSISCWTCFITGYPPSPTVR